MNEEIKGQFLEITASISLRALRQIFEAGIQQAFSRPNFWIEQLHFYAAHTEPSPSGFTARFYVADIADDHGFFSPKVTDDHIKALLLPVLVEMLQAEARRLVEREVWLQSVRVQGVHRMPRPSVLTHQYRRWLGGLR